ncbi:MAG: carboxypeptidase regulatory-like domain-containing protein [Candidatus Sericytochromatia bacterium]|nr:carboxypeptidase regulatory-like domain-containing protein [Candidatus Sericytochromatia bacterium]
MAGQDVATPAATAPVVTGRVVGTSGQAVADVLVEAFGHRLDRTPVTLPNGQTALIFLDVLGLDPLRGGRTLQSSAPPSARTDGEGRFSLQLPGAGVYNVEAVVSPAEKAWKSKIDVASVSVPIGDMALAATSVLTGRLTMPDNPGSPDGAEVYIAGSVYRTTADASGQYRFENVPAGTVDVMAFKENLRGKAVCISVAPGGQTAAPDAPMQAVP